MKQPLIFDIKRYAIHDGPGIRITVFFKGCPLSCRWCHNPESQSPGVQKLYTASRCIGARECIGVCPAGALTLTPQGIVTDREACLLCGKCADACPTKAMELSGKAYTHEEVMKVIERERVHMDLSGGGVTFSGGEPLLFPEYLIGLLEACGQKGIHRAVDTCGYASTNTLLDVARHTDLFLYDLKLMDPARHQKWTGVSNELILKNLKALSREGTSLIIRVPLIKNVNTDEDNLTQMARFISQLPGKSPVVNLLPYHPVAEGKYRKMGIAFPAGEMEEPTEEEQKDAVAVFERAGVEVIN